MILPAGTDKCPVCGFGFSNNGTRRGRQSVYCKGPTRHYHSIDSNLKEKNMDPQLEGITIDEFRKRYDNRYILREAAKELKKGRLIKEKEFVAKLKLKGAYKDLVQDIEFEPFRGKVNADLVFWSHPDTIDEMKNANPPLLQ